jgi:nucleotide-binding universal stress UspA family protein
MATTAVRKILVPIDFSEGADAATALAAMLVRTFKASIELVHIWQPPPLIPLPIAVVPSGADPMPINMEELARSTAGAQMKQVAARLHDQGVGEVRCRVGIGNPAHDIVDLAELGHFDMIVMGTHGRGGIARALLGSVAEKVVRHATCPVVTVHATAAKGDRT